ncbi:MAG: transcription antitermination factor NusB [Spirochaetia bacterium]
MGVRRWGRILAVQALYCWEMSSPSQEELLSFPWMDRNGKQENNREAADFARLLLGGTLENIEEIDGKIKKQLEHWDFSRLGKVDLAILRLSAYCLLYRKDIPATVTIDEAVDISKDFCGEDSYRFINGVLDGMRKVNSR